jgi:hypothetical protein
VSAADMPATHVHSPSALLLARVHSLALLRGNESFHLLPLLLMDHADALLFLGRRK